MRARSQSPDWGAARDGELTPTNWRSMHAAAAAQASGDAAWYHRVAVATSADEGLAAELEAAASLSEPAGEDRPGPALLLEWAADLSADSTARERRLLAAAVHRVCAGSTGLPELWTKVESCEPSALRSCALAGRALLEARPLEAQFHLGKAHRHQALPRRGMPPELVAAVLAGLRATLCLESAQGRRTTREATAGLAAGCADLGIRRWLRLLLAAGRCYDTGPRAAADTIAGDPGPASAEVSGGPAYDAGTALALGSYLVLAGDAEQAVMVLSGLGAGDDVAGEPALNRQARPWLALACHQLGWWRQADDHVGHALASGPPRATATSADHAVGALIAAHRASWPAAEEHLRHAHDLADTGAPDEVVLADVAQASVTHARGVLLADHPALARLARAGSPARKHASLWLPLQAEALVESGSEPDAVAALARVRSLAEETPYLKVAAIRLAARLEERRRNPATAQRLYESVRDLPRACLTVPFQVGLLEHYYGRLLCALGATADGSAWLSQARNRLGQAGAVPYAQRCAADLAARQSGLDRSGPLDSLTDREHAVAQLVAAGLTNQEVAARLYVSAKTVEYHLAQIYGKLAITSRRQLVQLIAMKGS